MSFRALGPLEVTVAGEPLPLGGPKPRMLLATLLLQAGTTVSTDLLIDVLWPGSAPRSAAANLRTYVHTLRRRLALGGDRLRSRPSGYLLTADPDEIDIAAFERDVAAAKRAGEPDTALDLLDRAEGRWRGHVLEDLPASHAWTSTLARLAELRLTANERRMQLRIDLGRHEETIADLRGLLAEHPLREQLWQQLITSLHECGRDAEATQAYAQAERVLRDELGTAPGPRLRELRALVEGPGSTAEAGPVCQLPLDLPDFTGRAELVADLVRELRTPGAPSVAVLSGPPGAGKTAVAVRVAHAVRDAFPDGQLHVDLAGTAPAPRSPADVLPELLRALGVHDANMPPGLAERSALLRSRLSRRRLCLVLDDAACAAQVRPLLPGTGGCAVLVTSRTRLPDLSCARSVGVGVLTEADAADLLTRIVGPARVAAEPESAAAILRCCGRLPLAIRVAAARLHHRPAWPLRTLADRLRDERRRLDELRAGDLAVRASVALSYRQLPAAAALAFRLLGSLGPVRFPGWVVAALLGRPDADDVLDVLVDTHLVELVATDEAGQPRYRLHDLLRCYAGEQGDPAERADALRRVLAGYLHLAVTAAGRMPIHFLGVVAAEPGQGTWRPDRTGELVADPMAWFAAERQTGVAAVELAAKWGFDDLAWRLAAAFTPYFDLRGHQEDWHRTHVTALAAARREGDPLGTAIVARNLGQIHLYRDDYAEALAASEEACALFRQAGDDRGAGIALAGIGTVLRIRGRYELALDRCHEALALFARAGDRHGEAVVRISVGTVWLARGCHAPARRWFADARELAAAIGDRHREAHALKRLGLLHQREGNLAAAREHVDRAIAIFDELGDDHCVGYANQQLGELCLDSGDLAHARLLLVNSLSVHRRNGDRRSEAEISELLGRLHETLGQPERARPHFARAGAIWRDLSAGEQERPRLSSRRVASA